MEYAIDKQAIADALEDGEFTAVTMLVPPGEWGYDPAYPVRTYEPAKARQLVIDAGYPAGLDAEYARVNGEWKIRSIIWTNPWPREPGSFPKIE